MKASALKEARKDKCKMVAIDPKETFSKQAVFQEGWLKCYKGIVDWLDPKAHDGLKSVDPNTNSVVAAFETYKSAALVNLIPAQMAGTIERDSRLANVSEFCAIDPASMKSLADNNIYVLGDASIAGHMPKSAFSANSQAKVTAMMVRGEPTSSRTFDARYTNTCWSLIETDDCVKVGGAYEPKVARLPRPLPLSRRRVSRRGCGSTSGPRTWAGITASQPTFSAEGFRSKVNRRG